MKQIFRRTVVALALLFGTGSAVVAQVAMTRTIFTGTYTPISTGTGATVSTAAGDDAVQTGIPIGFTFNYLGNNYTDIGATTNGAAGFVGMTNTRFNVELFTTTTPNSILAPWWDDLTCPSGSLLYQTQGSPGSQTFTLQWSALSFYTTSTAVCNFQIVLYEGTNVIEFRYGAQPTGTFYSASESASIGIKSATGGNGQYIDAVTGSSYTGNAMVQAQNSWPTYFYRFTPGAPTVLPGGTYTVGTSGNYPNITEAVADINHRGISGAVTLSLINSTYDQTTANGHNFFPILIGPVAGASAVNTITMQPASGTATISSPGNQGTSGWCVNQNSTTLANNTNEPVIGVAGGSYITLNNLNLTGTVDVDRGLTVNNSSGTVGTQNCTFQNLTITLNRTNTGTIAIEQRQPSTPSSAAGANSNNAYLNLNISNTYSGIFLNGNATFPDAGCTIGTTSATAFNTIGGAAANDIGNGGNATYGIRCLNVSGVTVRNNEVRNVTVTAAVTCDGIFMDAVQGTSSVHMNKVHDLRNTSTSATTGVTGIRADVATTGTHTLYVYNNFAYGITSAYTGSASNTRHLKGIFVQSAGGGVGTSVIHVDNNNILMDGSASANISSACIETGTTSGPVINVRNNALSNITGAQTAPAAHYNVVTAAAGLIGNTGSVSNYNAYYIGTAAQGFVGRDGSTDRVTMADWQTALSQDANSIASDPSFTSATDLHVNAPPLNGTGTQLAWVTVDIDNQTRNSPPDIGADEFVAAALDAGATVLVTPVAAGCYTSTQSVVIRVRNYGTGSLDFSANPVTVTVNVTGATTATLNFVINNNSLNGNVPLASGASVDVPVGTFNMSAAGTYTFNAFTALTGDANASNDALSPVNIDYQPGTIALSASSVCAGNSVTMTLSGNTSSTFQWQMSTDGGNTWNSIPSATTSPYTDTPTDTTLYRSLMCGSLVSTQDTVIYFPTSAPVTVNDTICGVDTVTLTASGLGTLSWYTGPSGGSPVYTGTTYTVPLSATTTYYVESINGGGIQAVGKPDNTGTGAQQSSTNYEIFDVYQNCTLVGAYVYPGAAGNVVCDLLDMNGALITSRTIPVTAADINQRTYVALNIPLTVGTNYRLAQGIGSVSMFRNDGNVSYPYSLPGYVDITNSAAGNTYFYFFYDWQILTGCASSRTPVTGVVLPTPSVTITAGASTLCEGDSTSLTATSANQNYAYTWTPAATLSAPTGSNVTATPTVATTYVVEADSAGCIARDTISIGVNPLPAGSVTSFDSLICIGQSDSLIGMYEQGGLLINGTDVAIPDANPAGATSTIVIPYSAVISPSLNMTVRFAMTHTWDGDMSFTLISPMGTQLDLCSNNGGSGDNFQNTTFNMSAATNITAGTAPFTGSYIPEGAGGFNVFNGENTQGTWTLFMVDGAGGDLGTLLDWRISFETNNVISWSSNPIGFSSTNDTVLVSPIVTTDYIFTVTDTATGCARVITETVMVNPPLALTMSNDTLICSGDSIAVTGMATGGDGAYSYSWNNGDTTAATTVAPTAASSYTLTVTDGCTTPAALDSVAITIVAPVMMTSMSSDTMLCANNPVVLTVMTTGGLNTSYAWSNGPATNVDSVMSGSAGSVDVYYVNITDACGSMLSDTVVVTSYDTPVAVASGDTTVCMGDTVTLMASVTNGLAPYTYMWSNGPVTANDTVMAMSTMNYVVTVTDACGTTAALDSATVGVFSMPMVTASSDTAVCFPSYAYLSSMTSGGDGSYTYLWSSGTTSSSDSVALFGTMMQYITVTDGCGNTAMDSVLVTVNQSPVAAFTETTAGSAVTFTDGSMNATSWQWNFGDSQTSTAQNPSHTYTTNGTYTVTLIVTNSCGSDTTTNVVMIDVGINDPAVMNGVKVYPNPSSDVFNVSFAMAIGGQVSIELFDAQGKLVTAENMENIVSGQVVTLGVNDVDTGIYLLKITGANTQTVYKLNVQH